MTSKVFNFKNIFTEYDDSLTKKLNLDPLGLQVVWTHYGQQIFHNKTTTVALDIRSYNINLFNHFIIYQILNEVDDLNIDSLVTNHISRREKIDKVLIVLENMLIWSWFKNEDKWGDKRIGLLGTSKASQAWSGKKNHNLEINFNHEVRRMEVLKNQKSLGVNGRYKGPFISMDFFDSNYSDAGYSKASELFKKVEDLILDADSPFKELYNDVMSFLKKYEPNNFIPEAVTTSFTEVFMEPRITSEYMKGFWLEQLGFTSDEAKTVYSQDLAQPIREIFQNANDINPRKIFGDIISLESKLTYITLLFDYLLSQNEEDKNIDELNNNYLKPLENFAWDGFIRDANGSVRSRLEGLSKINDYETLLVYHKEIMISRKQSPWIELKQKSDTNRIRVNIIRNENLSAIEKKLSHGLDNEWVHDYYISSVRNIKKGLGDETV